jgi:hypothetical protein
MVITAALAQPDASDSRIEGRDGEARRSKPIVERRRAL